MTNWRNPTDRKDIEDHLDRGMLFVQMGHGKYWEARRNGRTQEWKTRPSDFRIPIKYGLRGYAAIMHNTPLVFMRLADSRELAEKESVI